MIKLDSKDIVLFSGDSITDGNRGRKMDCNHIFGHGYQYIVGSCLALDNAENMPKFINKGYSGATMSQLLETWNEDVIANSPTVISILAGVNDGIFGFSNGTSVSEAARNYEDSLRQAIEMSKDKLGTVQIIVCEPFYFPLDRSEISYRFTPHPDCEPPFKRPDTDDTPENITYRVEADKLIRAAAKRVAQSEDCLFVPLFDKFKCNMEASRPEYFVWDGVHPTMAGHMLIAREWLKIAEDLKPKGELL